MNERRAGLLLLSLSVALMLTGAARPLNPRVARTDRPSGPVPADCDQGLGTAPAPRIDIAQIPEPEIVRASYVAPPSLSLRGELHGAHTALTENDRPAFDVHLANAKAILRDYPAGGERSAAESALRVFEDAAFVWDAQFDSPFFDDSSPAYARMSRYPGYADAVRRGLFMDDREHRFYPAAESRDFLTRVAGERLTQLGVRTQTRVARAETPQPPPSRRLTEPPRRTTVRTTTEVATTRRGGSATRNSGETTRKSGTPARSHAVASTTPSAPRRSSSRSTAPKPSPSRAMAQKPAPPSSQPSKSAVPAIAAPSAPDPSAHSRATVESAPATPPATVPTPGRTAASPVAGVSNPPAAEPHASGSASTSAAEGVESPDTGAVTASETTLTATDGSAAPVEEPAAAPAPERRSVVIPALLILIGLGVLIVLFRASK